MTNVAAELHGVDDGDHECSRFLHTFPDCPKIWVSEKPCNQGIGKIPKGAGQIPKKSGTIFPGHGSFLHRLAYSGCEGFEVSEVRTPNRKSRPPMILNIKRTIPPGLANACLCLISLALLTGCVKNSNESATEMRSTRLFDGKTLEGWHEDVPDMDSDSTLRTPFIIRDSLLVSLGTPGGHLITDSSYHNYILDVEYRFAGTPGNCGVLVHASAPRALYAMFPKSIEVQMMHENAGDFWCIVEDIVVPDMEKRRGPRENWGITEGKERRVQNLTDGSEKPLGEWNAMRITCLGDSIQVIVNGDLVNFGYDCTAKHGQIALQAEGSEVEFRKVLLTPIRAWPDSSKQAN